MRTLPHGPSKVFTFLALLAITLQQCSLPSPSSSYAALLQSGSSTLYNAHAGNREHIFTVTANFNVPSNGLQVAACKKSPIQPFPACRWPLLAASTSQCADWLASPMEQCR
jgi:hypothetical protein